MLAALLLAHSLCFQTVHYKFPGPLQWGRYKVIVTTTDPEQGRPQLCRIQDPSGKTLLTISAWQFSALSVIPLPGKQSQALHIDANNGSGVTGIYELVFVDKPKLRNILTVCKTFDPPMEYRDLNGDGRYEVICDVNAFMGSAFDFAGGGRSRGNLRLVLEWDGTKYVDRSWKFPSIILKEAEEYKSDLIKYARERSTDEYDGGERLALEYYGHMAILRRSDEAKRWLRKSVPYLRRWLDRNQRRLEASVQHRHRLYAGRQEPKITIE